MKPLICSNIFGDFTSVDAITRPINSAYAAANDCDYVVDTQKRCEDDISFWWEKIAYLRTVINTRGEGDLIIWIDADSIIMPSAVINNILPPNKEFGMVPIYHGMNCSEKMYAFNAGVIAMKNTESVRYFMESVWDRRFINKDDETAMLAELPNSGLLFCELNPKWNCWQNNVKLVTEPAIKTFHGIYPASAKVDAINSFLQRS